MISGLRPSIDAHVHLWGDGRRFPFTVTSGRPPPDTSATLDDLTNEAGPSVRGILAIQPSQYGYDHRYLFHTVSTSRRSRTQPEIRAVPLVDPPTTTEHQLAELAGAPAVAGVRVIARGQGTPANIESTDSIGFWTVVRRLGLPVGLLVEPWHLTTVRRIAERYPEVTLVVDHLGRIRADAVDYDRHVRDLLDLAELPQVHVKISAVDALSAVEPPHFDVWPLIRHVLSEFGPQRCMYGTDWPYRRAFGTYDGAAEVMRVALADAGLPAANVARQLDATAVRVFGFAAPTHDRQ